jgi:hypothetical protein
MEGAEERSTNVRAEEWDPRIGMHDSADNSISRRDNEVAEGREEGKRARRTIWARV